MLRSFTLVTCSFRNRPSSRVTSPGLITSVLRGPQSTACGNDGPIGQAAAPQSSCVSLSRSRRIQMIIEGKELPERVNPNAQPKVDVQQVLKPAPGQQPNVAPRGRHRHKKTAVSYQPLAVS